MAGQDDRLVRLKETAKAAATWLSRAGVAAATTLGRFVGNVVWPFVRLVTQRVFEVLFALILLFEEWGWRPLAAWIGRLARFPIVAKIEGVIAELPPYGALAAFVLPSALLFPLKLIALYLIATGHALMAGSLFIGAKVVGTAVLARLYHLTQPKLMQIGWFAHAHDWFMPWKDRMFASIRASWAWRYARIVKHRVGQAVRVRWLEIRPVLLAYKQRFAVLSRTVVDRVRAMWPR